MHPVETYLKDLVEIRRSAAGVAETSYYPALSNLLNEVGKGLKPKVLCIVNIRNRGAGIPDGGFFTPDQLRRGGEEEWTEGQSPARGVLEVKAPAADALVVAEGEQVERYFGHYRQVLVTNLWDFVLVGRDASGRKAILERFRLADSEAEFWSLAERPRALAREAGVRLLEYLRRVLLRAAPLSSPEELAWLLAAYAREARLRVEGRDVEPLKFLREALEEALGIRFEGARGEHFFVSTLIQTLFYGAFSAWAIWARDLDPADRYSRFDWRNAPWTMHVPMLGVLFGQLAQPGQLGPLGLVEVLDWAAQALNRVERTEFFARFDEGHAVQYFYEPFLQAFDPELRKELGVWYTPPEIVEYMVERVDRVLREELSVPDGLADPRVYVLDPCCGTGAYLAAALRRIKRTLAERGGDALAGQDVKRAARDRVFGFEILPAPYVVAHLQIGALLRDCGAPLRTTGDAGDERAAVFLTNALTGWEPPTGPRAQLRLPELESERDAAEKVKRETPILVVLGNPPYNGFAGMAVEEERDLTNAYRATRYAPAPQGQGLNDLYVRFFRMAERRIVEQTGRGVVCFISNYSWLDGLSFTGMRERYLEAYDRIWIDCLNGDKYKTGKLTPEGEPDPSVFSTEFSPEGIQVGTAIALLLRKDDAGGDRTQETFFRHLWGREKGSELLQSADHDGRTLYQQLEPRVELGLPFMPSTFNPAYLAWPLLPEVFPVSFPGVKTSRDPLLVDIDRERLVQRMGRYFDPAVSHEEMRRLCPCALQASARFKAVDVRERLQRRGFLPRNVVRYCYRPFDLRWLYWEPETKLLDEKRSEYFPQVFEGNVWLSAGQRNRKEDFYQPQFTRLLADHHIVESNVGMFPLCIRPAALLAEANGTETVPNLSEVAAAYLAQNTATPADLFHHALAVLHAPAYRRENAGALRQDWPRLPLPAQRDRLLASAGLGTMLAALLDPDSPAPGVTAGTVAPDLRGLGCVASVTGTDLDPAAGHLDLTAGWGHAGKGGVTMPGRGRFLERDYTPDERRQIETGATLRGLDPAEALSRLGEDTCDVYLNETALWRNVPAGVWEFRIGGYQVVKKWLSYREKNLLGRPLTLEEVREVMAMVRRIAAILLLEPALDENYRAVKAAAYPWPRT